MREITRADFPGVPEEIVFSSPSSAGWTGHFVAPPQYVESEGEMTMKNMTLVLSATGFLYFRRMERTFADRA